MAGLELVSDGTVHRLSLEGRPAFHITTQPISNQRLIEVAGTTAAVAMWEEGPARAQRYAISLDGRSFTRPFERRQLIRLHNGFFDPTVGTPPVAPDLRAGPEAELFIVQFKTRPIEAYRQAVREAGGTVHQFMADQAHLVRMSPEARKAVEAMPFVRWVGPVHPAYKVEHAVLQELNAADFVPTRRYHIKVLESDNAMKQTVADEIVRVGGVIDQLNPNGFLLDATLDGDQLRQILRLNEVQFVDRWGAPEEDMNIAREISGANLIETAGGFTGAGVRGEVMDGGLRTTHVEFAGKSILIHGGNTTSFGHGTPVTGIVFATGNSNAQARGLLPDADTIIFSAYQQLGDRYAHTGRLVDPNGPYRAVFQTNSWGSPRNLVYSNISAEMDELLFDHNILITQSQSNAGNRQSRPQAWAKNVVSVGGVQHQNTLSKHDDCWCGGASIGPADDGRIKPDLTHFYHNITTTGGSNDTNYTSFGGTSGATPITAGYFGLLFQMWSQGVFGNDVSGGDVFDERPAASTAKAIAINTASQYSFSNPNADLSRVKQGWGLIDMGIAFQDRDRMFVIDESEILGEFENYARNVLVTPGDPDLRVTLVFRDPAGNPSSSVARINDLSLRVVSPSGVEYWGNNGLLQGNWSIPGGDSNTVDTVENVFVQNPETGAWRVEVIADEINQDIVPSEPGAQALFSLVIAGGEVVPDAFTFDLPADPPVAAAPGDRISFPVEVVPGGETVDPSNVLLNYRFDDGAFASIPLTYLGDNMYEAELPVTRCGDKPEFFISAVGNGGAGTELTMPVNAPATVFRTDIGGFELIYTDDFENDAGWTVVNENLVSGAWVRDWPDAGGAWGDPTTDFDGSGKCWITGNEPGRSDVNGGPTRLITTPFELPQGTVFVELSFAEWFYNNTNDDPFWVEVSNDGQNWEEIYRRVGGSGGWRVRTMTVRDEADLSQPIQFRFSTQDIGGNSITQAGIDAMSIRVFGCADTCRADINADGVVDADDFFEFLSLFAAGDPVADMNGDGVI
ncbi:MAG: hypothetical protein EA423_02150, partial [Phycisphaerales bacterium]